MIITVNFPRKGKYALQQVKCNTTATSYLMLLQFFIFWLVFVCISWRTRGAIPANGRDAALQRASPKATQAGRGKRKDPYWLYVRPSILKRKNQFAACSQMFVFSPFFLENRPLKLYAIKTLYALALMYWVTSEQEQMSHHRSIKNHVLVKV